VCVCVCVRRGFIYSVHKAAQMAPVGIAVSNCWRPSKRNIRRLVAFSFLTFT